MSYLDKKGFKLLKKQMIFQHKFDDDFNIIKKSIAKKEKFSFSKFTNGEIAIMQKNQN
jgi:hypothetical protein